MSVAIPGELAGQPVLILKEGSSRSRGRDAQRNNIMAAMIISEVVKSTLGPRGMDKMLVSSLGDVTITNDGATILKEIDVQHPAAKMMVEAAKTQDEEVGDGTTSVVIFAGELLKKAEELIDQNIHPTIIVGGYKKATDRALDVIKKLAVKVDPKDKETLRKVAVTSTFNKSIGMARDHFAGLAIDAVNQIKETRGKETIVDIDQIQVVKKTGESLLDAELIKGMIIDKEVVHPGMPKVVEKAKIALLDCPLEIEKTEFSAEIRIRDPSQMKAFLDEEEKMLRDQVELIKKVGANVIFCQKGIDDLSQHLLAKAQILAVRRVKKSDMEKLSRATGAKLTTNLEDLKKTDLGFAGSVEEKKIGEDKLVFVEDCKDPKSVSILVRAGLERMVDEAERALHDSLCVVADVVEDNRIIAGGGAIEVELARNLRSYAKEIGGREQLAIEAYADSLEGIPKILANNAGLEPIDIMVALRTAHEKGKKWVGVDALSGEVTDMMKKNVVEPAVMKEHLINAASETASMILRIDDVIASSKAPPMPPGGPGGMPPGGMPPGMM
jgi:thermosome